MDSFFDVIHYTKITILREDIDHTDVVILIIVFAHSELDIRRFIFLSSVRKKSAECKMLTP